MHKVFMKNIKTTKTTNFLMSALCMFGPLVSAFANKSKIKLFLALTNNFVSCTFNNCFQVSSSACFSFQQLSRVRFFSKVYSCWTCHMSKHAIQLFVNMFTGRTSSLTQLCICTFGSIILPFADI